MAQDTPIQQELPPEPPFVVDPAPTTVDTNTATPIETPVVTPENLFVIVSLETTGNVLTPDSTVAVTVTVRAEADLPTDKATLTLTLPKGIATTTGDKNNVQWSLPALQANEVVTQSLDLQIEKVNNALKREVGSLIASVDAPSYPSVETATLLAFAPTPPATEDTQDATGAVISSVDGDVVLLAQAAAAPAGVVFRYSELYNWETVTPTQTAPVSATTILTATALTTTVTTADATSTDTATPGPKSKADHNLDAYRLWQLDALQNGQNMHLLDSEVLVQVSVKKLIKAGVDPVTLTLWTREGESGRWTPVPTIYDAKQQRLQAWLPHFSQFGLGAGLQQSGDMLPSVKAFTVDQLNGGASVSIPLETPAGLGGMSPNLSLSYSSITLDDLFREAGSSEIEAQAGSPGIGWSLGGVSYIARTDTKYDDNVPAIDKKFALVLNGMRVSISYQDGRWRTNPEIFAKLEWSGAASGSNTYKAYDFSGWTVWTGDGTKYEFGDAGPFTMAYSSVSPTATALERTYGGRTFRLTKRWYLRKVTDTLGNTMEYQYQGEQGWEKGTTTGCIDAGWITDWQHWYTRAIDPSYIYWSGQGGSYTLRARFTYSARSDTYIKGDLETDCLQPLYGSNNQLTGVAVEAYTSSGWQTQRSYSLGQNLYSPTSGKKRIYLSTIDQLGKSGGLLVRYSFGYSISNPNRILLTNASTNLGGSVTFIYNTVRASCSNATCPHTKNRYAVTQQVTNDGLNNTRTVAYDYGVSVAGSETSAVAEDGGFMGYQAISTTVYAQNDLTTVIQWERLDSFSSGAVADRSNPHPLRGKLQKREVRNAKGGTIYRSESYDWKAYWLENSAWQTSATAVSWKATSSNDPTPYYPITWIRLEKETVNVGGAVNEKRYSYEGAYGNQTEVQEWADSNKMRTTTTDYFPNSGPWIVNKPARIRIFDGAGCQAETRIIYDGNGGAYNTLPTQGLVRRTQQALKECSDVVTMGDRETFWHISYFEYDAYGNQKLATDFGAAAGQDVTIHTKVDDIYHLFPTEQWYAADPLQKETALYYGVNQMEGYSGVAIWGAMQEHCGVNGVCTRQSYDQFGRRLARWEGVITSSAWGADTDALVTWEYTPYGSGQSGNTVREWRNPRGEGNFVRKIYNGLGELIQEQRPYQNWTASGGQEIMVDYLYDALGRQTRVGVPWLTAKYASGDIRRATTWSNGYTLTAYDAINRPTLITAPNEEQQQYNYVVRQVSVVGIGRNGEGNKILQWQETDGLGRLKLVRTYDLSGSTWVVAGEVVLGYRVTDELTSVSHPSNIGSTTMGYDLGGRKTSMSDPDLGSWSYGYDRQSKLTRQTDARGKTTCLYYDGLARLVGKHFRSDATCPASVATYDVSYSYDQNHTSSNRSRGQLTGIGNSGYSKALVYNSQGLLSQETVTISGAPSYVTKYGYDGYLRPSTTTYPDNEIVTTSYNAMGLPNRLTTNQGTLVSGAWQSGTLVDGTTSSGGATNGVNYDEAGRLTQMRFPLGSNLWRTQSYWPWTGSANNSNGRLKEIKVGASSTTSERLSLLYGYDSFGNIGGFTERYGSEIGISWLFCYDNQNRLKRGYDGYNTTISYLSNCAATATSNRVYSSDAAGRLTNYEGSALTVNATFPGHGVKNSGYAYDENGNLKTRGSQTLEWDAENHLSAVKNGAIVIESYLYDADGQRVKKGNNLNATYYVNAFYEVTLDNPPPPTPTPTVTPTLTRTPTRTPTPTPTSTRNVSLTPCPIPCECNNTCRIAPNRTPMPGEKLPFYLPIVAQEEAAASVEVNSAAAANVTKYYYFNGQRVAMRKGDVLTYLHGDHLGSTVLETNSTGAITTDQRYLAYGRQRDTGPVVTEHKFTGQKLDGTGLMYYGARYYDPEIGQFISPDTLVPDPTNLFAYNRYMYVAGNPMRLTDSSGHVWETVLDAAAVGYGIYDIYNNGLSWESGLSLAADVGGLVVPFVPSAGACVRWCDDAVQYGDEAVSYVGDKVDEGWQATKEFFGMGDEGASAGKAADNIRCPVNSFSADTLVATAEGLQPITEVEEGELVYAYNEATGEVGLYPVTDELAHLDHEIVTLVIEGERIYTTPEHPFFVNGQWIDAANLGVGDLVRRLDGSAGDVEAITIEERPQVMYNLTVAEAHTFFVGEQQWLVHNCSALKYWKESTAFDGTKVFQRNDLFDLGFVDSAGRTNLQRMKAGLAPIGNDGESVVLHHLIQTPDSALVELSATLHRENSKMLHINPNTIPSGIDRRQFDSWRRQYWKNRAKDIEQ